MTKNIVNSSSVIEETQRKPYSAVKRMGAFLIDGIIAFSLIFCLLFFVSDYTIGAICKNPVEQINQIYAEECEKLNYPYIKSTYGLYEIDLDAFIEIKISEGKTTQEASNLYDEAYEKIDDIVSNREEFKIPAQEIQRVYYLHVIVILFGVSFIFEFVIPLFNKYHQSIGMLLLKCVIVNSKTNIVLSRLKLFIRFNFIYVIELLLIFLLFSYFGLIFLGLITIFIITITKKRLTLHELILNAKAVDKNDAYLA